MGTRAMGRWKHKCNLRELVEKADENESPSADEIQALAKQIAERLRTIPKIEEMMQEEGYRDIFDDLEMATDSEDMNGVLSDIFDFGDSAAIWMGE